MHNQILNLLLELTKIRSISNDIDKLVDIVNFVDSYYGLIENRIVKRFTFNDKPSIVIQNFEGTEADIIFCGHLDVVPATESGQFEPIMKDGKIYARGVGDMKSGVAIMMVLMKEILLSNFKSKKICLMLTCDEKVGGNDGVKKLSEKGYTSKIILLPSNGDIDNIVYAEKGIISMKIKVTGKSSHSSKPWLGDNAILKVFDIYNELKTYIQDDEVLHSDTHWSSSVNLTILNSGTANNIIPSVAEAGFDIRLTQKFLNISDLLEHIKEIVSKNSGEINSILTGDVLFSDIENNFFKEYINSYKEVLNKEPKLLKEHGASDGRYFSSKGIPVILQRPTCKDTNTKGEYVEEKAIYEIYEIYKNFVFGK